MDLLANAGVFIYPLALCSLLAAFITIERLIALLPGKVCPPDLLNAILDGKARERRSDPGSILGRILLFARERSSDAESLKAFARLEVNRMERGIFLLEVVVGAAPLLGLLGTVTGLTRVFGNFSVETGMPDPAAFITGIALALTTTIIGLAIAIPALIAHAYLMRRVESHASHIHVAVECLADEDRGTGRLVSAGVKEVQA